MLVVFHSTTSGLCRRLDALLAQVLQRGRNHRTFTVRRVSAEERPDLHRRFGIEIVPTLVVVEERRVRARLDGPGSTAELRDFLAPWLS